MKTINTPEGTRDRLFAECRERRQVQDSLMDEDLFFNSNNHLNDKGMEIRTEKLIDDLRAAGFIQ